ncbi:unnamed protein product [Clonostachys byssicola]|uniref:Uncharacterized protein n=1 Tax=Clonostachys byssicola TaxID=160290 RepID=A0A9N9UCQ5_9HYPO|nr:unnamed protein product [Clonostachys byssicola]
MNWLWSRLNPRSKWHEEKSVRRARTQQRKKHQLQQEQEELDRQQVPTWPHDQETIEIGPPLQLNGSFFSLASEIRHLILREAFGDQTVHLDLDFRHPFKTLSSNKEELELKRIQYPNFMHANISANILGPPYDRSLPKSWMWFSCVCHRCHPSDQLSYGRKANASTPDACEPRCDNCLRAGGLCREYPGEWPSKCFIGISGWLLTCRQAYREGIDVLYGMNTIHIQSPSLICGIEDFLSPNILSMMTSLELVWSLEDIGPDEAFIRRSLSNASTSGAPQQSDVIFPSLRHLRIGFKPLLWSDKAFGGRIGWGATDDERKEAEERIHDYFLPRLDQLLERIAPPAAEVVVSWDSWLWYSRTDLKLLEVQGREKTQMHQPEIGGLACWRVIPMLSGTKSTPAEESVPGRSKRNGYWIHVADAQLSNRYHNFKDWHRHELYGLIA